jgi:hypothetical protein
MKDAGTAIRKAFFEALNGVVTYETQDVPVVDGKLESDATEWIVLGEQGETDRSNKSKFSGEYNIELVVVNKTVSVAGKKVVETIADDIMEIMQPTPSTHGLTIDSPFIITYVKYEGSRAGTVSQNAAALFDNVKTLNYKIRITQ